MFFYLLGGSSPYFWFLHKHYQEKNELNVFICAWAYIEIRFLKKWSWTENKWFSIIWVCPWATFNFWVNMNEKTNIIFAFWLAWSYLSLLFLVTSVQSRKKVFFYHLGVSLPYFWFLSNHVQENKSQLHVVFGLSICWNAFFWKINLA